MWGRMHSFVKPFTSQRDLVCFSLHRAPKCGICRDGFTIER
jgi:hypothetical protein